MRRLILALICCLVIAPAAVAASRASGDGVLELESVSGTVSIGLPAKPAHGALWGQMDSGTLKVLDPDATDRNIFVSGQDRKATSYDSDFGTVTSYWGKNLHFRVTGGDYRLWFKGTGIDLTAVGVGAAYLSGDPSLLDPGSYAVDDAKWSPVPVFSLTSQSRVVPFGDPTSLPATKP